MKAIRPWLYFVTFIAGLVTASTIKEADQYFQYFAFAAGAVLSVMTLWQWWRAPAGRRDVGIGIGRLPLPASWKRWVYDEFDDAGR